MSLNFDQITENLFVGARPNDEDWKMLKKMGVTANLNLQSEDQPRFENHEPKASLWLPAPDWWGPDEETIEIGARYIEMMIDTGHKVYVHCHHGAGRAPIVGAAYLVLTGMSADQAIDLVRQKRPGFKANPMQYNNLRKFAKHWHKNHKK